MLNQYRHLALLIMILTVASCFKIPSISKPIIEQNVFDPVISQKYATYASIAFCPQACIQAWNCGSSAKYPKLVNVTYIYNTFTKAAGYIGYDPATQTLITSWRGSDNPQNWIEDFNFEMEPYLSCTGCYIHTGFYADYKLSQKKLLASANAITRFYKVSKILCTGHSLGAAISLINGIQFVHKFPDIPVQVHNFGQPRVGNRKLSEYMMSKISTIFRVVHNKDLVPHLPPEVDYHHPAYEVFYDENMTNYKICSSTGEDSTCSNKFFPNYDTNDHDFYFIHISGAKC